MISIRNAVPSDALVIYQLMKEIAQHHHQENFLKTSPQSILEAAFGNKPKFSVLLAEFDQQIAGYLSYSINYSIWLGADYALLDDLFVRASFRNRKIGWELMDAFRSTCSEKQLQLAKWEVETDNTKAIKFYERLGVDFHIKGVCKWSI